MAVRLGTEELNSRLEVIDAELQAQALPLKYRPLESFKRIHGDVPDGPLRGSLFDSIAAWYQDRHGKRAAPDGTIGRIPVLLRGEVYLLLVPLTEGDRVVRLVDQIDGLPEEVGATLSREEFEAIGRKAAGATISFQKLYNLTVEDGFLDAVERGLVWRALFDLETAATTLRHVGDTQNTIFQIHQAAEKFLKVALKRSGSTADLKRFGHNLPAVFEELKKFSGRYSWLEPCVVALQAFAPNMEIRYSVVPRRVEEAIEAFHAALSICWRPCANVALRYEAGFGPLSFLTGVFLRGWDSGEIFLQGQPSERSAHSGIDAFRDISGSRSDDVRHFGQFLGERFVPGGEEPR